MGRCLAFGPSITDGCEHPMVAAADACYCRKCGVTCKGKFDGCSSVWVAAAGPVAAVALEPKPAAQVVAGEHPDAEPEPDASMDDEPPAPDGVRVVEPVAAGPEPEGAIELLEAIGHWVSDFTDELRAVSKQLAEQREETRTLMEAQQRATGLLLDAVRQLPARVGDEARAAVGDGGPRLRAVPAMVHDPVQPDPVQPEVVVMDSVESAKPEAVDLDPEGPGPTGA
jgi:hypothetical protein